MTLIFNENMRRVSRMNLSRGKEKLKDFRRTFKFYPFLVNPFQVFPEKLDYFKQYQLAEEF